jgi:Cu/Zn superoxide dismutase
MKKLSILVSVLAMVAVAGCSSDSTTEGRHVTRAYETHQNADVTKVGARMYQMYGNESHMGSVRFTERDGGLSMVVELFDTRPNHDYYLTTSTHDFGLPAIKSNAAGKINETFILNGITAADLKDTKFYLTRDGGKRVGQGDMKKRWF